MTALRETTELTVLPETQSSPITPMEMLNRAVSNGADIDVLEKLMSLQDRWEKSQARKEFDAAIAAAKAEIQPVERNSTGHNSKKYANFAAIAKAIDPIISRHGLSYRFRTTQADRINVTCVLSHRAGHYEETTLSGPPDASGSKNAIQAIGSTLSYLQRYSLVQALGLAAADDDDGKAAGQGEPVSDEQLKKILTRMREVGVNAEAYCKVMKVERVDDTLAKDFATAMRHMDDVEKYAKKGAAK